MNKVLQIFRRDVNRLVHNWVALIVVAGVCLIPSLYAWFNIAANIDPYSNTQGIKIAVANMDQGAFSDLTGELNAGREIVKNLKSNDDLGWTFTDQQDAVAGVKSGDYYASLLIPEDFSESLISIFSGEIKRPQILYYLNEKKNAIAPKITDSGASAIQEQINATFVSIATESVSEVFEQSVISTDKTLSAARDNLDSKIKRINRNLDSYQKILSSLQEALSHGDQQTKDTLSLLDDVKATAVSASDALSKNDRLLSDIRGDMAAFSLSLSRSLSEGETLFSNLKNMAAEDLGKVNIVLQTVNGNMDAMIDSASNAVSLNKEILQSLKTLNETVPGEPASDLIRNLEADNKRHQTLLQQLKKGNQGAKNMTDTAAQTISSISTLAEDNHRLIDDSKKNFEQKTLPSINRSLDSFASLSGQTEGILKGIPSSTEQLKQIVLSLDESFSDTKTAVSRLNSAADSVQNQIKQAMTDLNALSDSHAYREFLSLAKLDSQKAADFISAPVNLKATAFYPVENYGSAMTPFYTNLAIWVGGIVLIAIFKLEVERDRRIRTFTPVQSYFGRWLLYIAVGQIQALIICLGALCLLKVQCISPPAFLLAGMLASFVYVNIIYALSITFKHIGKALCVILIIIQIPGSAGTYPIEMTPSFFQKLNPLLPFTYGIDAIREAMAGIYGNHYLVNMLCLLIFVPLALFVGLAIRPLLLNLNLMFDKKLAKTDLMICEQQGGMSRAHIRLATMLKVLANQKEFREKLQRRSQRFEAKYKTRVRRGFFSIVIIPLIFLVLMFSIDSKLVFLVLWIVSIIGIATYLICLEYIHQRLKRHRQLAGMSDSKLVNSIKDRKGGKDE